MEHKETEQFLLKGPAKILLGGGMIALLVWKLPILELFVVFFYTVLVPMTILGSLGLISQGAIESFGNNFNELQDAVQAKTSDKIEEFKAKYRAAREEEDKQRLKAKATS